MKKIRKKGLYIILFDNGIKFGISDNFKKRLLFYKNPWCRSIEKVYFLSCFYPRILETRIKERFSTYIKGKSTEFINDKNIIEKIIEYAWLKKESRPLSMRLKNSNRYYTNFYEYKDNKFVLLKKSELYYKNNPIYIQQEVNKL